MNITTCCVIFTTVPQVSLYLAITVYMNLLYRSRVSMQPSPVFYYAVYSIYSMTLVMSGSWNPGDPLLNIYYVQCVE